MLHLTATWCHCLAITRRCNGLVSRNSECFSPLAVRGVAQRGTSALLVTRGLELPPDHCRQPPSAPSSLLNVIFKNAAVLSEVCVITGAPSSKGPKPFTRVTIPSRIRSTSRYSKQMPSDLIWGSRCFTQSLGGPAEQEGLSVRTQPRSCCSAPAAGEGPGCWCREMPRPHSLACPQWKDRDLSSARCPCSPSDTPISFFFFLRFYLFIHERQRHRQREEQAPCREPDGGLNPRTSGSRPGPEAVLNRRATQAAPHTCF